MISAEFSIQKHRGDVRVFTDSLLLSFQWAQKWYKCEESLWWRLRWAAESNANSRARQIFQLVNWKSQIDKRATVPEVTLYAETAPLQKPASHPVPALKSPSQSWHEVRLLEGWAVKRQADIRSAVWDVRGYATCTQAALLSKHRACFRQPGTNNLICWICILLSERQPDRTHADEVFSRLWC